jgi:hypothetical protein
MDGISPLRWTGAVAAILLPLRFGVWKSSLRWTTKAGRAAVVVVVDSVKICVFTKHMREKMLMWTFSNMTSYDLARLWKSKRFSRGKPF